MALESCCWQDRLCFTIKHTHTHCAFGKVMMMSPHWWQTASSTCGGPTQNKFWRFFVVVEAPPLVSTSDRCSQPAVSSQSDILLLREIKAEKIKSISHPLLLSVCLFLLLEVISWNDLDWLLLSPPLSFRSSFHCFWSGGVETSHVSLI